MNGKHFNLSLVYWLSNSGSAIGFTYLVLLLYDKGISKVEIGLLALPFSITLILSNTVFGKMSDDRGRRPFILVGLLLTSITIFLYIFPITFWSFFGVRFLHGLAMGIFPASITGTASDCDQKMGNLSSFGALGWATGAILGGVVAGITQLEYIFVLSSILLFISFIYALIKGVGLCPKNSKDVKIEEKSARTRYAIAIRNNWREYLVVLLRHGTANSIWIYWALFLKDDLNLTFPQIGIVQLTNTVTQFIFMKSLGDKFHPKKSFIFGTFISALAFALFPLTRNFQEIVLAQIVLGISFAFFMTGSLREVENSNKLDNNVATATGLLNSAYSSAQIFGPLLSLYLISVSNTYTLSMNVAAIVTTITAILYIVSHIIKTK